MNDQDLRKLLKTADAASHGPVGVANLAANVRQRARRRTTRRIVMSSVSIPLAVAILAIAWHAKPISTTSPQIVRQPAADPVQLHARFAALEREAAAGEQIANAMLQQEAKSPRAARRTTGLFDVTVELNVQRDQTARLLIDRADWLAGRPDAGALAADEYRRVIEIFPASPLAQTARDRLNQLKL